MIAPENIAFSGAIIAYTIRGSILACGLGQGGLWKPTGLPFTPRPSSP